MTWMDKKPHKIWEMGKKKRGNQEEREENIFSFYVYCFVGKESFSLLLLCLIRDIWLTLPSEKDIPSLFTPIITISNSSRDLHSLLLLLCVNPEYSLSYPIWVFHKTKYCKFFFTITLVSSSFLVGHILKCNPIVQTLAKTFEEPDSDWQP